MLKNPQDRRVRRTRRLLKESLLEQLKKKPFSEITVSDITDGADMSRATFYLHFSNPAALLESVEQDLLEQAQELLTAHLSEMMGCRSIRPVLEPVLDFVVDKYELCALLFKNEQQSHITDKLLTLIQSSCGELFDSLSGPSRQRDRESLVEFVTYGLLGLICTWFRRGMDLTKEELLSAAEILTDGAVTRFIAPRNA